MKILIVYYSHTGNTEIIAKELAQNLNCDLEKITEKNPRSGVIGMILAGKDAALQKSSATNEIQHQIADYDLVIIGTPVWAWNISNPIRGFLEKHKQNIKKTAFFATMGGSGDKRAFSQMEKILGFSPTATIAFIDRAVKKGDFKENLIRFAENIKKQN